MGSQPADRSGMEFPKANEPTVSRDSTPPDTVVVKAPEAPAPARAPAAANEPAKSEQPSNAAPRKRSAGGLPLATTGRAVPSGEARYAATWANVREGRSTSAAVVRVLNPGEQIRVRDYEAGWWQAMLDGKPIGYIGNSVLRREPLGPGTEGRNSSDG